jgi:hypothetical protein
MVTFTSVPRLRYVASMGDNCYVRIEKHTNLQGVEVETLHITHSTLSSADYQEQKRTVPFGRVSPEDFAFAFKPFVSPP